MPYKDKAKKNEFQLKYQKKLRENLTDKEKEDRCTISQIWMLKKEMTLKAKSSGRGWSKKDIAFVSEKDELGKWIHSNDECARKFGRSYSSIGTLRYKINNKYKNKKY